jgi:uncharacterized protein (TIGR03790 family)
VLTEPSRIDYLVVIRGLPYRVAIPGGYTTSLSAMLQVSGTTTIADNTVLAGRKQFKSTDGKFMPSVENPLFQKHIGGHDVFELENASAAAYTASIRIANAASQPQTFHRADVPDGKGYRFSGQLYIVSRLDGFSYQDARDLVDRALASEEMKPVAPITCMAAADEARGARDPECRYVVDLLSNAGINAQFIPLHDPKLAGQTMSAYLTGAAQLKGAIDENTYVPGAFVDNLTSFGAKPQNFVCSSDGQCPEAEAQTSIARFVRAGATFVHGTVNEPLNYCFPNAGMLLLYTMGYNVAESVFFNQPFLYWQNLLVGDPLTSPWAERPVVSVDVDEHIEPGQPFSVSASHPDGVIHLAVFVDGKFAAQSGGTPIEVVIEEAGSKQLLAIATAKNVPVARPGWPNSQHFPQSDVQGWKLLTIQVGNEPPVEDPVPSEASSGCQYSRAPQAKNLFVPMLLLTLFLVWGSSLRKCC